MQNIFTRRNFLKTSAQMAIAGSIGASVLAACGGNSSSGASGTITFWHTYNITDSENKTLVSKVIPGFKKQYPNVTVNAQDVPYASMLQKLIASVAGGRGPDIVRSDIIWMPQLAKVGALVQVDDIMSSRKDEFYPGPLATCTYKDHYYGLPLDTNTRVVIANSDLLASAGVTAIPTTTDEFKQNSLAVTALGNNTYGYSEGGVNDWSLLPWVWSFGGDVTDDKFTRATGYINNDKTVASLAYLIDLYKTKALSPSILGGSSLGPDDALGKNKTGFVLDGPWAIPSFQVTYPNLKFELALMPAGPEGSTSSVVGGEDIAIMSSTKHLDATRAFMQYMTTENVQRLMGTTGQMPVLKSLANDSTLPSYFKIYNQQLQTAKPRTVHPNYSKISEIFGDAFNQAFRGLATPKAALDAAAAQIDPLLQ